ncbi:MAG: MFS transporter, partial [Chloroflexi bacterium]|nr:MFS transporter [Chloroflexota bacterium]
MFVPYQALRYTSAVQEKKSPPLSVQLAVLTFARLFLNTGLRMAYPFLPAFSRGLGLPLAETTQLFNARNVSGFIAPVLGSLSEKYGRRPVMVAAMVIFGLGMWLVVIWPVAGVLALTMVCAGIAKVTYDPAMQSYLGDRVPYEQRGRAISVTELAWAGGILLGAPVIGWLIARYDWRSPFVLLGVGGLVAAAFLHLFLPRLGAAQPRSGKWRDILAVLRQHPVIWGAALFGVLVMAAQEITFIVYGGWMEEQFGLSLTSLGLAATVIGVSEFTGELFAGWSTDRFGKRPVTITAAFLTAIAYALLPFAQGNLTLALITMFGLFFVFELTVVGNMPLLTELVPQARSLVMSVFIAAGALGRVIGGLVGPWLWVRAGFMGNTFVAAAIMLAAAVVMILWLREGKGES